MFIGMFRRINDTAKSCQNGRNGFDNTLATILDEIRSLFIFDFILRQIGAECGGGSNNHGGPSPFQIWSTIPPAPATALRLDACAFLKSAMLPLAVRPRSSLRPLGLPACCPAMPRSYSCVLKVEIASIATATTDSIIAWPKRESKNK